MNTLPAAQSLGDFLRERRCNLQPQDFGLPAGQRRRVAGLRREEVAVLCGISPTWYTWIEQGRTDAISEETLVALAEGLRLNRSERAYLFELMSRTDPNPPSATLIDNYKLDSLVHHIASPAYVLDRHWNAIVWNQPAAKLFADWLGENAADNNSRNLLKYVFLNPRAPSFVVNWSDRAKRLAAEYRADSAACLDDRLRQSLICELTLASEAFAQAWQAQQVMSREGGVRGFNLPDDSRVSYQQFTLQLAQQPDLKLTVLTPIELVD